MRNEDWPKSMRDLIFEMFLIVDCEAKEIII